MYAYNAQIHKCQYVTYINLHAKHVSMVHGVCMRSCAWSCVKNIIHTTPIMMQQHIYQHICIGIWSHQSPHICLVHSYI